MSFAPRTLLAHPGTGSFVQEVARALYEGGMLERFATTVVDRPDLAWRRILSAAPVLGARIDRELGRRRVPPWLLQRTVSHPVPELLRVLTQRLDRSSLIARRAWERSEPAFDRWVARTQLDGIDAVYGYELGSLETFRAARARGLFIALDLPAFEQEHVARIFQRELARWPALVGPMTRGLIEQWPIRSKVVREQIELASCVIANSRLTLRSYTDAGFRMPHAAVVPLAAPEPIASERLPQLEARRPMRFLFAGTLNLRKGGHYLLEAFRREPSVAGAELMICGHVELPDAFVSERSRGVKLRGHVPASELSQVYLEADVLVLPTLSDGFGLVVTEALAHGLPVITTDCCGAAELIEHGVNGLITRAADVEDLMQALAYCAADRERLHAMRAQALATARARSWSDYRSALRELIAARYKGRGDGGV